MTVDDNTASLAPPPRRSVTLTLPSAAVVRVVLVALVVAGLIATVVVESVRIHTLSAQKAVGVRQTAPLGAVSDPVAASAVAAATSYATSFATYSYQHLSRDFAVTEAHATDPFLTQYRRETAGITGDLVRLKSVSSGKVLSAGVVSATPTSAVVDLFLNQTIVNSARTKPSVEPQRMTMTLTRSDPSAQWLISKVTLP